MILLKNGLVLFGENELVKKDVLVDGDRIVKIADKIEENGCIVKNVENCWIIPGAVDVHAHLREPGFEHKETVKSGTMSASKGGITTIVAMPNLKPTPDSLENLKVETDVIDRDAVIRVYPTGSVTKGLKGQELSEIATLSDKVAYFTDDGLCVNNLEVLSEALKKSKKIIASHAEASNAPDVDSSEYIAVRREIELVKKYGGSYHFCHLSTAESFDAVRKAIEEGLDVTCEVMPHHLLLNRDQIKDANWKMNPPLRSEKDRLATVEAMLSGLATMIATDHAPHSVEEKSREYDKCPNGIIGFETMFPLIYTNFVKNGLMSHKKMLELTVYNPSKRFNLIHGDICEGGLADVAVLDVNTKHKYCEEEILSKAKNTPFIGFELFGFNRLTLVGGKIVFDNVD